jgi:hypothetical protein
MGYNQLEAIMDLIGSMGIGYGRYWSLITRRGKEGKGKCIGSDLAFWERDSGALAWYGAIQTDIRIGLEGSVRVGTGR